MSIGTFKFQDVEVIKQTEVNQKDYKNGLDCRIKRIDYFGDFIKINDAAVFM